MTIRENLDAHWVKVTFATFEGHLTSRCLTNCDYDSSPERSLDVSLRQLRFT